MDSTINPLLVNLRLDFNGLNSYQLVQFHHQPERTSELIGNFRMVKNVQTQTTKW